MTPDLRDLGRTLPPPAPRLAWVRWASRLVLLAVGAWLTAKGMLP